MKSSRVSFNPAVAKGVFRRCWPLWAAYLGFLLLTFPFPLLRYVQTSADRESLSAFRTGCMQQI